MPHSQLIRSNLASIHYVHTLESAYNRFLYLIDPDFAHQNDQEAWFKVRRDAKINQAIQIRRHATAGLHWQILPAFDEEPEKRAAEIVDDLVRPHIRRFHQSRFNLAEAIFRGSSFSFIEGERRNLKIGETDRQWWIPTELRHIDRWRFRIRRTDQDFAQPSPKPKDKITTIWEIRSIARGLWEPLENPEWFVRHFYEQTEDTLGYGRGLLQSIYFFWKAKEIVLSQGLAGLERWAQGLIQVAVDGLRAGSEDRTNDEIVDEWIDELTKTRSEHTIVSDIKDKITVHQGPGQGHQMGIDWINYLDNAVTQLILHSVLPTGGGAEKGSFARAAVEADTAEQVFQSDRESLSETLTDSLIALVWERNRAAIRETLQAENINPDARMPMFRIIQQPKEDPQENVQIIATALSAGIPLVRQEVYEKIGFTPPMPDEDVIEPIPAQPPLTRPFQSKANGKSQVTRKRITGLVR